MSDLKTLLDAYDAGKPFEPCPVDNKPSHVLAGKTIKVPRGKYKGSMFTIEDYVHSIPDLHPAIAAACGGSLSVYGKIDHLGYVIPESDLVERPSFLSRVFKKLPLFNKKASQ